MSHFDYEDWYNQYEHDLLDVLTILKRIDVKQFAVDLKINDKEMFKALKTALNNEDGGFYGK